MFKYKNLTDYEKLRFTEDYIKILKQNLRQQEKIALASVKNLNDFITDVRQASRSGAKLVSYKQEMVSAHKKNRKLQTELNKSESRNFYLREKLRKLKDI